MRKKIMVYCGVGIGCVVLLLANLWFGSVSVSGADIINAIVGRADETTAGILMQIRFPRALSAWILGGALALSGYLLQTFFHNPIAGPFVLGVSSGSKLFVAMAMIVFLRYMTRISSAGLILVAFVGAVFSMLLVLALSSKVRNMSKLVISGIMIGYICSAITDFIVTFAQDADIVNLHNWSRGSFSGMSWRDVIWMTAVIAPAFVLTLLLIKPMSAYQLGEQYAENMGVSIKGFRVVLILLSSLLSACVVAFAGPISFVGVAVPHLIRNAAGTNRPSYMIPACFLGGGFFCLACDLIARTVFAPTELSISTVTAVFGAPIVIWMLVKRKEGAHES